MRNPNRIPIVLKLLEQKWKNTPDLRFFQFIEALKSELPREMSGISRDYFYMEDTNLINELNKNNG